MLGEKMMETKRIIEPRRIEAYECPICEQVLVTDLETAAQHVNFPVYPALPLGAAFKENTKWGEGYYYIVIESPGRWSRDAVFRKGRVSNHFRNQKAIIYSVDEGTFNDEPWEISFYGLAHSHGESFALLNDAEFCSLRRAYLAKTSSIHEKDKDWFDKVTRDISKEERKVICWTHNLLKTYPELEEIISKYNRDPLKCSSG